MENRQNVAWRWAAQVCIILALIGFVLFVFFGPTGLGGSSSLPADQGSLTLGEDRPFALFLPVSGNGLKDESIDYTSKQIQKIRLAAQKARMSSSLYVPRTGAKGDYLMEIRVFQKKRMIQLLYPHFGILESARPIHTESQSVGSKKTTLSIGKAEMVRYQHGGYHLTLQLSGTYIAMDSAKINQISHFKKIAESIVLLKKLNP
ncbi:MAG TPA: hypothetical protein VFK37_03860 [Bacillales bacterium]|nr:hypothetical protein [Bacillales bacterium]